MKIIENKIKAVAVAAAKRSGKMLLKEFEKFDRGTIQMKSHYEILTKCDLASERIILSEVMRAFPEHEILSEESGQNNVKSDYLWIVDPIDGTTNFSIHNPLWSISIGVAYKGEIIFGLVYAPYMKEMYVAVRGRGATKNGKKIRVSDIKGERAFHTFCHGAESKNIKLALAYYESQKSSQFDCRQLGSAAIELAWVASGRAESIFIPGAKPWDIAAGVLLVNEAGGKVTDFDGMQWNLKSKSVLATNVLVHEQIIKLIGRL